MEWRTWITYGLYSLLDIQDYFENILKKHGGKTVNPSIRIYINKIENRIIDCMFLSCHVRIQSETTLYSCLNVREVLARNRYSIWSLSDCNRTRTHNDLVHKPRYELSGCRFESHWSHLNRITFKIKTGYYL